LAKSIRLKVVPHTVELLRTRSVLTRPEGYVGDTRFFIGTDPAAPDLLCGSCGSPLVTGALMGPFIVFQCGGCRTFNDTGDAIHND
jgi:hypothetical protein